MEIGVKLPDEAGLVPTKNRFDFATHALIFALSVVGLVGCAAARTPSTVRVALLAPFEGRYREIGYNALYAARLAQNDIGEDRVELLPIDDGGSIASATDRARALALDPLVISAMVIGPYTSDPSVQAAFGDVPMILVGNWGLNPTQENVFALANPFLERQLTISPTLDVTNAAAIENQLTGGDMLALEQFRLLRPTLDDVTILSVGELPSPDFIQRYKGSDPFAPEPGLLATLTYDTTILSIRAALESNGDRSTAHRFIQQTDMTGLTGLIRFQDRLWVEAQVHAYRFDETGQLIEIAFP